MGAVSPICSSIFVGQNDRELYPLTKATGDEKCGKIFFQGLVLAVLTGVDLKAKEAPPASLRKQRKAIRPGTKKIVF